MGSPAACPWCSDSSLSHAHLAQGHQGQVWKLPKATQLEGMELSHKPGLSTPGPELSPSHLLRRPSWLGSHRMMPKAELGSMESVRGSLEVRVGFLVFSTPGTCSGPRGPRPLLWASHGWKPVRLALGRQSASLRRPQPPPLLSGMGSFAPQRAAGWRGHRRPTCGSPSPF